MLPIFPNPIARTIPIARALIPVEQNNRENNSTTLEEVLNLIGREHYVEGRNASQHLIRFLINGGELPTANTIMFQGLDFSFDGEEHAHVRMPENVLLRFCSLVSPGSIDFFHGVLTADVSGAKVRPCASDAIGIANVEGSIAQPLARNAIVIASNGGETIPFRPRMHPNPLRADGYQVGPLLDVRAQHMVILTTMQLNPGVADLSGADLRRADLSNANLIGADFDFEIPEYVDQNPMQQVIDNSVASYLQRNANQVSGRYNAQGGIQGVFAGQKPSEVQVTAIHSFIKTEENFEALRSNDGMKAGDATVFLPEGRDCIILEDFDPADHTEWCLLKQGNKKYNLVTAATAEHLMSSGNRHPFIQRELMAGDIVRGKAVLDLFNVGKADDEPLPTAAITDEATCCTLF